MVEDGAWTIAVGPLTPTLKIDRPAMEQRFAVRERDPAFSMDNCAIHRTPRPAPTRTAV
jgi:hypothetical protein